MTPEEITTTLETLLDYPVQHPEPDAWQVEAPDFRLLVLLSSDQTWLRVLVPIVPEAEAQPFLAELLQANFDETQTTRYALSQGVLWGVFHHSLATLTTEDLAQAITQLDTLRQTGLSDAFSTLVEHRVRQIVQLAKLQGQSLEATLQNLDRFYEEGMMGELNQSKQSREETLAAWRYQLQRLWSE